MLVALRAVRHREPAQSSRAALLRRRVTEHGREGIRERGYFGCSLRELALEARTTPSAILRLFGSKHGLLRTIYDESLETALGWLDDVRVESPAEQMTAGVLRVLKRAKAEPRVGDFLVCHARDTDFLIGRRGDLLRAPDERDPEGDVFAWFHERAHACVESGAVEGLAPLALAEAVVGIMERFLLRSFLHRESGRARQAQGYGCSAAEAVLRLLFEPAAGPPPHRRSSFAHADRLVGWDDGTRDRLVASAWVELATHGYGSSTTAAIARGARTSESELFRLFSAGKPDLLREVQERCYAFVLADLEALDGADPRSELVDGSALLWWLAEDQPSLMTFVLAGAGNTAPLLIAPRDEDAPGAHATLPVAAERYARWFRDRARAACPPSATPGLGNAAGEAVLGIAERMLLTWHRAEPGRGTRRAPSPQDAIAPIERIVQGLQPAPARRPQRHRRAVPVPVA